MALTIPKSFSGTPAAIKTQVEGLLGKATTPAEINAITLAARNSSAKFDNAVLVAANQRVAAAAPKPPAPAPAPAKPVAPAPVKPTGITGATPPASLKLPDAATAVNLINQRAATAPPTMKTDSATGISYYLVPPAGSQPARWDAVSRGATVSNNGLTVNALNQAQTSYFKANQAPLPKPAAPAQLTTTQRTALENQYRTELSQAKTQADFDRIVAAATTAGAPINAGVLSSFQTGLTQRLAVPKPVQTAPAAPPTPATPTLTTSQRTALENQYRTELSQAKTQADFDRVVNAAASAGAPINSGVLNSFQTSLTQRLAGEQQAAVQARSQEFQTQLGQAKTQAEFDNIVKPSFACSTK
jgi:hypothetical protein